MQVGYGDVTPVTGMGQLLGCLCAIFGVTHILLSPANYIQVVIIGLPIPIIGSSYTSFYSQQKRLDKQQRLKSTRDVRNGNAHVVLEEKSDKLVFK